MKHEEIRKKLIQQIEESNPGEAYIWSQQVPEVLSYIELVLSMEFEPTLMKTAKLFATQYSDLQISKKVVLDFLSDLLQVDIVDYVYSNSLDTEVIKNDNITKNLTGDFSEGVARNNLPIATSSPIAPEESLNIHDSKLNKQLNDLSNHFNTKISQFVSPTKPKTQEPLQNTRFEKALQPGSILLMINTVLIFILCGLSIIRWGVFSFIDPYKLILNMFANDSNDIYWWQMTGFTERIVWNMLDYIQTKVDNLRLTNLP